MIAIAALSLDLPAKVALALPSPISETRSPDDPTCR
jgi:hypothetical protein